MNKLTNILLGAILLMGVGGLIVSLQPGVEPNITVNLDDAKLGGDMDLTRWGAAVNATTVAISMEVKAASSTSHLALASKPDAIYRRIQNLGSNNVTCSINGTSTSLASGVGIMLLSTSSANSIYERYYGYWGAIYCIADTSTTTISVIQY